MGEILDVLYGNNLGCDISDDVFDIASHLLQFEQKFLAWQHSLPETLFLVQPGILRHTKNQETLRYRFIITIRFLNLRILSHRPLLSKYLEFLGNPKSDAQQLAMLKQVGINSVRICVQSALTIIKLMREVLSPPDPQSHLLGAWWFSLYYVFNAALVIYSALLVEHQSRTQNQFAVLEDLELSIDCLQQAIECLSLLCKGNRMTEKCIRYTSSLAHLLSLFYNPDSLHEITHGVRMSKTPLEDLSIQHASNEAQSHDVFDFLDATNLHMGLSWDDLLGANFSFPASLSF